MSDTDEAPVCPHCGVKIHGQWVPHGNEYYHVECWEETRPDKDGDLVNDCEGGAEDENEKVDLNILSDGEIVERLTFKEGESFGAEIHCDDFAIEVVNIE